MSDTASTRKYSEEEIGRIIRRTAELQQGDQGAATNGLSLGEVQQIAEELGLDGKRVPAAASELEWEGQGESGWVGWKRLFARDASSFDYERVLSDGRLAVADAESLVEEIHGALPAARGQVQRTERQITLAAPGPWRPLRLQIYADDPVEGPVRVRVRAQWRLAALVSRVPFFLSLPLVLNLDPNTFDPDTRLVLAVAVPAVLWIFGGRAYSSWVARERERAHGLVRRIEAILRRKDRSSTHGPATAPRPLQEG